MKTKYPDYWLYVIFIRDNKEIRVITTQETEEKFEKTWDILTAVNDNKDLQWIRINITAELEQLI